MRFIFFVILAVMLLGCAGRLYDEFRYVQNYHIHLNCAYATLTEHFHWCYSINFIELDTVVNDRLLNGPLECTNSSAVTTSTMFRQRKFFDSLTKVKEPATIIYHNCTHSSKTLQFQSDLPTFTVKDKRVEETVFHDVTDRGERPGLMSFLEHWRRYRTKYCFLFSCDGIVGRLFQ